MCNDLKKTIHFFSQDIRIFIENVHIFLKNVCGLKKLGECLKPISEVSTNEYLDLNKAKWGPS